MPFKVNQFFVAVIITSAALGMDVLGANNSVGTGGWYWIRSSLSNRTQTVWMLLAGNSWEIACYLLTALVHTTTTPRAILQTWTSLKFEPKTTRSSITASACIC
ncbi:hypothetical protein DPMN_091981 [Dreissena polymorpha]|uniref:Uncharacterized protein n=1 Tax=Dreissena polymorpha TaxID=45954 RepID=A0A9D4L0P2_DREPO|nr:hypothetical protein DPMN_091981 [Dreissena polymorpha]